MIPKTYEPACGGSLSVYPTDKFKSGLLSVSFVLPIERTGAWKTSLLLSVLRRGTEKYHSLAELNAKLDYLYGTEFSIRNFYRGDRKIVGFTADILNSDCLPEGEDLTEDVLDVMKQILFYPLLDENGLLNARYVESEKKNLCDSIRSLKNNPRGYASERCRNLLYRNEPCGVSSLDAIDEIMAVSATDLTAYWRELITEITPSCFYVGNAAPEALCRALSDAFTSFFSANAPMPSHRPMILRRADEVLRVNEPLSVSQSQLVIGLRTGISVLDDNYYICSIFNELLGASPVSKLFMNVREKLSLCYFCSSYYNPYKGTVMIHCGLDRENREAAEGEILAQIDAIAKGDFSDDELEAAKRSMLNAARQIEDSPGSLENFYFSRMLVGRAASLEECRALYETVTREDIIAVAKGISTDVVYFLEGVLSGEEEDGCEDN